MKTHAELADQYPLVRGKDFGDGKPLEELVKEVGNLIDQGNMDLVCDYLDEQFLFGSWGFVMRDIRELTFSADIRGFIVSAYVEGKRRGFIEGTTDNCIDCGVDVPKGQGLGISVPDEEWIDRSKSRPIEIKPMCVACMAKRTT